jgi:hypothetical protein
MRRTVAKRIFFSRTLEEAKGTKKCRSKRFKVSLGGSQCYVQRCRSKALTLNGLANGTSEAFIAASGWESADWRLEKLCPCVVRTTHARTHSSECRSAREMIGSGVEPRTRIPGNWVIVSDLKRVGSNVATVSSVHYWCATLHGCV